MADEQVVKTVLKAAAKSGIKGAEPAVLAADIMTLRAEYLALEQRMGQLHKRAKDLGATAAQQKMQEAMNTGLQIVPILYKASQALIGNKRTNNLR